MSASLFPFGIELRDDTNQLIAEVLGEKARRRPDGTPSHANLLGDNSTGTGTRLINKLHGPSGEAIASIGARYAVGVGMDLEDWTEDEIWAGIRATHKIVRTRTRVTVEAA